MLPDPDRRPAIADLGAVDLIVLGSGAAGLTAALTGLLEGLRVAVLELAPVFGGTTARSSGTVWVPDNRLMRTRGMVGDRAQAETYLDALIGDRGPREPWLAFLDSAPAMQADLETRAEILFRPFMNAPDYRELPGAAPGGRPLEPVAFDGRRLGNWFPLLADPLPELTIFGGMMVTRAEAQRLVRAERSISALVEGARLLLRHARDRMRYRRGTRLVMGNALVARLLHAVLLRGGFVYESTQVRELVKAADGRIDGVIGISKGTQFRLTARRGVVLAGGGFPSDPDWRERELPKPTAEYSPAAPLARGSTIELALAAGAALGPSGAHNALWFPSSLWARPSGGLAVYPHIALDRAKPGAIIVDGDGRRFANEALSYHDFCCAVYAHGAKAVPCWLIADRGFVRRYGLGVIRPRTARLTSYLASGYLKHGETVADLADAIGVPADTLRAEIERFNTMARAGKDKAFQRGETAYQRSNGDAGRGLGNPCLAPVGLRNLYAVALYPTPLGTSRGLAASVDGEVLDAAGRAIAGLYVAGNDMQSCFAGEYPGAGAQIGPGMTFGWRAAKHAARAANQV